ncbi:hydrolase [Neiella marina]|uniref:Hydrolase n=1 Tax=Neiella marina TaxID=508461 RepID=A0A8J2XPJ7_9GAMM|nr:agarase [Neiella marina]GGA81522.1 hydrolase [Neiella marina]
MDYPTPLGVSLRPLALSCALCFAATTLVACNETSTQQASASVAEQPVKAASSTYTDAFANEQKLLQLVDFDKHMNWLSAEGVTAKAVKQHNATMLQLDFASDHNIPELLIAPPKAWSLSQYGNYNLAFDVANNSTISTHLYLNLINPEGKAISKSIALAPGFDGTVYIPLTGVEAETEAGFWGDVPAWHSEDKQMVWRSWRSDNVDLSTLAALKFFTIGNLQDRQVVIGDIRLRANPPTRKDWMIGLIDRFGQNAKTPTELTVESEQRLKQLADQELADLAKSEGMPHRSKFGGYTNGPQLEATGYFRTEKVNGKWWMVDPEGYPFFSHGPANVRMANLSTLTGIDFKDDSIRVRHADEVTPEDSMGIVQIPEQARASRYVASTIRHNLFEWLPDYTDPLADHYSYRRSTHKGAMPHGETFSFYRANLERRYGDDYLPMWHQVTMDRMKDWGFTSFGNWVDPAFYHAEQVPYFANGWIIGDFKTLSGYENHWGLMPDPFDPVFKERAVATIEVIARDVKNSPWCAGIFIDNEKSWGEREGSVPQRYGVILDGLSKSAEQSPAKAAFAQRLQQQYGSIDALNKAWQSNFDSWQTLNEGVALDSYSDAMVNDLSMLLEMLGEQYFNVVHNTLAELMPHHLYMGARMANWGMPDEIIKASLKYSDVLSFNIYEEGMQDHYWQFLEQVDLPVVIGEFHIGTTDDSGMLNPGIVHASDQADRARMYKDYMKSVLEKPYMVGAHWFQYVDEPVSGRAFDGENANIGFVTVADIPYPGLVQAVKEVTSTMYQERLAE